jgi:hypothetical protein
MFLENNVFPIVIYYMGSLWSVYGYVAKGEICYQFR